MVPAFFVPVDGLRFRAMYRLEGRVCMLGPLCPQFREHKLPVILGAAAGFGFGILRI